MHILDGISKTGSRRFPEWIAEDLNGGGSKTFLGFGVATPSERKQGSIEDAADVYLSTLRALVDQWLDSGMLGGESAGYSPWDRSIYWSSPSVYPVPLVETLRSCASDGYVRIAIGGDGRFAVTFPRPFSDGVPGSRARAWAFGNFIALLDSPVREKLFRCEGCGQYFVRARMPKKGHVIYHGVYCAGCPNRAAVKRTNATRKSRRDRWLALAVKAYLEYEASPRRKGSDPIAFVTSRVNKGLPRTDEKIARNTISRNLKEIKDKAERRKHATRENQGS